MRGFKPLSSHNFLILVLPVENSLRKALRAVSSIGRALHLHCRGKEFDPPTVHQKWSSLKRVPTLQKPVILKRHLFAI